MRPPFSKLALLLLALLVVATAVWPVEGADVTAEARRTPTPTRAATPVAPQQTNPTNRLRLPVVNRDTPPTPTPTPTPAPRSAIALGTNVHDQNFEMVQEMGFPWIKLYADWDTVDPNNIVRQVDGARARYPGVRILVRLDKSPAGARTGNDDDPLRPEAWQPFLKTLAPQLKGKVQAYELFNEPNLKYEWNVNIAGGNGMPSPRGYARIVQLARQALNEVDPSIIIVTGGLSSAGGGGSEAIGDLNWVAQFYDAGARGSFDALGSHPYGGPCSYEAGSCGGEGIYFRRAEAQHDVMVQKGDTTAKVWATEMGWLVDPRAYGYGTVEGRDCLAGLGGRRDWVRSPQDVANQLVGAHRLAAESWPWMGGMFFFNFDYAAAGWNNDYNHRCDAPTWYAIVAKNNMPGRPYTDPAFTALQSFAREFGFARAAAQSASAPAAPVLPPLPPNPAADRSMRHDPLGAPAP